MISTYLTYRTYAADLNKTLSRVASETMVAREAQYYKDNIGSITTVDAFMKNSRVFNYAMKAYGLEDMANSKAFMSKVLKSDLTDSSSFVRTLTDARFLTFAKAFNFSTDGTVASSPITAISPDDEDDMIGLYSDQRIRKGVATAAEAQYYQDTIGLVRTVDDLLGNSRLLNFALESFGLDPSIMSTTTLRGVLTSDVLDPQSYANQLGDTRYIEMAKSFLFSADGSLDPGVSAQTAAQVADTIYYNYGAKGAGSSPAMAAFLTQNYENLIGGIATAQQLLADDKLLNFALTAVGLNPNLQSKAQLLDVLTSDLSDPDSVANSLGQTQYRQLAALFNFKADGTLDAGVSAQTVTQRDQTIALFYTDYDAGALASEQTESSYFKLIISNIGSIQDLQSNSRVYNYVLTAYGLDQNTVSKTKFQQILKSDLSDPGSYANTSRDPRFKALAAAFNFGPDGLAQPARTAQSKNSILAMAQVNIANAGSDKILQDRATAEATYYGEAILDIQSVDQFLKNTRIVAFALEANGLQNEKLSNDVLRQILTSDPLDQKSFVNRLENARYRPLAAAYNFDANGNVPPQSVKQAQARSDTIATADLYLRQTLELNVGNQDEGARLALYFQRKASSITSAYSILGDKALFETVRTALSLPASMSNATIEVQAQVITKKLNLDDLKDPKKVERFIARFAAMYEITTKQNNAASLASMLFSNQ